MRYFGHFIAQFFVDAGSAFAEAMLINEQNQIHNIMAKTVAKKTAVKKAPAKKAVKKVAAKKVAAKKRPQKRR